ncbi:hypothetical protein HO675_04015 [Streptococcus suis]|nr:hypothetical protein [Streptococcus suis]
MKKQVRFFFPFFIGIAAGAVLLNLGLYAQVSVKGTNSSVTRPSSTTQSSTSASTSSSSLPASHQVNPESEPATTVIHTETSSVPQSTVSSVSTSGQTVGMDIEALVTGDLSGIAGRWVNSQGVVYVIDAKGMEIEGVKQRLVHLSYTDRGTVQGSIGSGMYAAHIEFIPAGASMTMVQSDGDILEDGSDTNQDRIWIGQAFDDISTGESFLYKEE